MSNRPTLLVLDQDTQALQMVQDVLSPEPVTLFLCSDPKTARDVITRRKVDLLMANLAQGEEDNLPFFREAKQENPELVIILVTTAQPTFQSAVDILRVGVTEYLLKPYDSAALKGVLRRALLEFQQRQENNFQRELIGLYQISEMVGSTRDLKKLLGLVLEAALKEFSADLSTILLWDEGKNCFKLADSREKNQLPFQALELDPPGPSLIYMKPQIFSSPESIAKVFPLSKNYFIGSLITYPLLAKQRIMGILYLVRHSRVRPFTSADLHHLSILAGKAAIALENSRLYQQIEEAYMSTINALANAVEARDAYTKGHTERVWCLAQSLAKKLGWNEEQLAQVKMGSILHDIGKIGVPDSILNKPQALTTEEFEIMKRHPQMGVKILEGISFLEPALPYVLFHHERYDGRGYPIGLRGEEIPVEGRFMAVVDTFDAITSDRPYRKNRGYQKAIDELRIHSGTQFDPKIAQAMIEAWQAGEIEPGQLEVKSAPARVEVGNPTV